MRSKRLLIYDDEGVEIHVSHVVSLAAFEVITEGLLRPRSGCDAGASFRRP